MGMFHCPLGVPYYDCEGCIDCGMCLATSKEAMIAASTKVREYIKSHQNNDYVIRKIAVCGKGGVGKSTVVTMLAKIFQEKGYSVLVIDTDESNPGLFKLCGLKRGPEPLTTLFSKISFGQSGPEIEWLQKDKILIEDIPAEYIVNQGNFNFLMVGKIEEPFQGCACSMAGITRDLVEKFVLKSNEIVLIDMEAGIESFGRGVERSVDTVLVIVEPSFQSMALADKINYMAEGMGISCVLAILNKVSSEETEKKMMVELDSKDINIVGTIGFDTKVSEAGFEGRALGEAKAKDDLKVIINAFFFD